ncbi:hypothetical protein [Prosthecodimorpha staleyi]|uniref:Uncharacterized protein n=1 Tax=Prosthecodimorpha staleyi TaxID=2840188 RepID=A0A947CZE1_9HYPH|nr:hypothetical protein [Prosthecodimorpha staleyi]MBT9288090.1 hypothetical protein [Prosthecodimorpha staleyi]
MLSGFDFERTAGILFGATLALGGLWLVGAVLAAMHRRAYNLTRAETAGAALQPDFTRGGNADRRAAAEAAARAGAPASPEGGLAAAGGSVLAPSPYARLCFWSRMSALVAAGTSLIAVVFQAVGAGRQAEEAAKAVGGLDGILAALAQHKIGVAVAVAVIIANMIAAARRGERA